MVQYGIWRFSVQDLSLFLLPYVELTLITSVSFKLFSLTRISLSDLKKYVARAMIVPKEIRMIIEMITINFWRIFQLYRLSNEFITFPFEFCYPIKESITFN
ncbi:hypothetical protein LIMHP_04280 [Leptospira interrogans serovar Manilae]|nr:hypothetical protein LIMLP_04295 [Leptospira interrogans serovar Manilae]AKP29032.1 hypothetical protein LIMHP_04280 [Leptospira interrogans serovar Manilae]